MKKIAIISTHPIQYQVPLFKYLNKKNFNINVFFASNHGVNAKKKDHEFLRKIKWDIDKDMLSGFNYKFSKNQKNNINDFKLNFKNLENELFRGDYKFIIIMGWNNLFYLSAIYFALKYKIKIILRVETNLLFKINPLKKIIKYFILKQLFKKISYFLSIGKLNKLFYLYHGVPIKKIFDAPYFVDNSFFKKKTNFNKIKKTLKIENKKVVLFVGKLIERKNPLEFLKLAKMYKSNNKVKFLMIGDGILKKKCSDFIKEENLLNTSIIGFVNQKNLVTYYQSSDLLVMPSYYETWGLAINEAFASNTPVICSSNCSAAKDLIIYGKTGFTYQIGELEDLFNKTQKILENKEVSKKMKLNIKKKIKLFSLEKTANSILKIINEK